jgi:NAD(P)H-nitrite reductase large subunit
MRYVIIGGGIAGTTAAEELRKLDQNAEISLITEEFHALYSRVLLPHYIKGKIPRERVFLKKETWYQEQNIEWIRGEIVSRVDTKNKHVEFFDGGELPFDVLLIASGSEVKLLPQDISGVSYLRTLDDADHLVELMRALPKEAHAVIYGGGFIACEYLNIFHEANIKTTIAYRGAHMWSRGISDEAGLLIRQQLEKKGITVIENAKEIQFLGEKYIEAVQLNEQMIPCSIVGVGVGVAPHFSFLNDSGVEIQNSILANAYLETNVKDVYVAGDVAEYFDERFDRPFITGNWMNAQMQGRVAAKNMIGTRMAFDLVSSYAMNIVGIEIIFIGDTSREHADTTKLIGSVEDGGVTEVFVRKNKMVGAILTGRNSDRALVTKMIQNQSEVTDLEKTLPL